MRKYIIIAVLVAALTALFSTASTAQAASCFNDLGWTGPKAAQYHAFIFGEGTQFTTADNCYQSGPAGTTNVPGRLPGQPVRQCYLPTSTMIATTTAYGPTKWSRWQLYIAGTYPNLYEPTCNDGQPASYLSTWGYR